MQAIREAFHLGRGRHLVLAVAVLALLHASPPIALGEPPPRNVLLITADDLNADSPGWMGGTAVRTPAIDALAMEGHRFVNAHATAPICQPSRSALMTGRVPHRNGAMGFDPIRDDVPTLVEVLRSRGWFTAAINKLEHMQPPAKFPWDLALEGSGKDPAGMREQVARCLSAADRTGNPFFINANLTDPHRPFRRPSAVGTHGAQSGIIRVPGFLEDIPPVREELAQYFGSVARLDHGLAMVLDALTASGHAGDTVVVFLSDNGMSFPFAKATVYRNGTWTPTVLRYPGMPPAATHDDMVSTIDLMPTLLELVDLPPPPGMDGRSWGPLLRGEPSQPERDLVVSHVNTVSSGAAYPQRSVRTRTRALLWQAWADGRHQLRVEAMTGRSFRALRGAARRDDGIASRLRQFVRGTPLALYDLERDPDERHNVLDDPAYRADVERLQAALLAHMIRTGDPELTHFRAAAATWRATVVDRGDAPG